VDPNHETHQSTAIDALTPRNAPINGPIDDPARTDPSVKFAARFRATGQFEFVSMTVWDS
jgi:hypothetical protein